MGHKGSWKAAFDGPGCTKFGCYRELNDSNRQPACGDDAKGKDAKQRPRQMIGLTGGGEQKQADTFLCARLPKRWWGAKTSRHPSFLAKR